jgi:antitoxin (DNA-binding transcriptional repressor) of toxin-antitoxin stability system
MHEAKTHLSRLVKDLRDGKEMEFIIAIGDVPAARLTPYVSERARPVGLYRGQINMADDFDEVDDQIAALFQGNAPHARGHR